MGDKHTPTPWEANMDRDDLGLEIRPVGSSEHQNPIAYISLGYIEMVDAERCRDVAFIIKAVNQHDELVAALEPFCGPGGGADMQAFHDLEDDVVVWKNSGVGVTAGDVRRALELLGKCKISPVSMTHSRLAKVEASDG